MDPLAGRAFRAPFADLPGPRIERCTRHELHDVVTIALGAAGCGADTWVAVTDCGQRQEGWLGTFLALPTGIRAHDPGDRVVAALDPAAYEPAFVGWVWAA